MVWGYELGFMRFKVQGLRIQGLGVMVQSLRFEDMDQDLGVSGQGLGFYGFKVYGLGIRVQLVGDAIEDWLFDGFKLSSRL